MPAVLSSQAFAGAALVRGLGGASLSDILASPTSRFLIVSQRRVAVEFDASGLLCMGLAALREMLPEGSLDAAADTVPVYVLGRDLATGGFRLAADVAGLDQEELVPTLAARGGSTLVDLRLLLGALPPPDLALAGHAVALSTWHQDHRYCNRCGAATTPIDGGAKRACPSGHRTYPRTDPVVIMLVESPDGSRALLGRSRKARPGTLTCLSGFVDQGEGLEEAVRREIHEEAGVAVGEVSILGSQPWPIGRAGSCELMIGCLAKAASEDLQVDPGEMAEARWVGRAEVRAAVAAAGLEANPFNAGAAAPGGGGTPPPGDGGVTEEGSGGVGFWIPPPFAIAHHLLKAWAERDGPWFGAAGPRPPSSL